MALNSGKKVFPQHYDVGVKSSLDNFILLEIANKDRGVAKGKEDSSQHDVRREPARGE